MEVIDSLDKIESPYPRAVITIGNFDGVHLGHQALFHQVVEKAEELKGTSLAMTFEPHPLTVLRKGDPPPQITLFEQQVELIGRSGIEYLICVPFTPAFASLPAAEFVSRVLIEKIGRAAVIVGEDYSFGRNREGNLDLLARLSRDLGFELILARYIQAANNSGRISSTRVREMIREGNVSEVRHLLGRYYQVRGVVVTGRNRGGKLLGFPTANIELQDGLCPKTGVYAVTVETEGRQLNGVANIGYSPTFSDHVFTVEVHILDFSENLYGKTLRVNFLARLRDEIRFSTLDALSRQIRMDIEEARRLFVLAPRTENHGR